jgi:hypothetical protein
MGTECKKILKRLQLSEADMKDPAIILAKLQDHFVPVRNILYESDIFSITLNSKYMKLIDQFPIKLRQLAERCNFGTLEDEMVRNRLVLGCGSWQWRKFTFSGGGGGGGGGGKAS